MRSGLLLFLALVGVGLGMVQVAEPPVLAHPWTVHRAAEPLSSVPIILALHPRDPQLLTRIATEVSDPSHPNYGNHLSTEQLREVVAPSHEVINNVTAWLREHGVEYKVGATGDMFHLKATVQQAEAMFGTQFHIVRNMETQQAAVRAGKVSVPSHIAPHIKTVFGVHGLPLPPRRQVRSPQDSAFPVTPEVLRTRYLVSGVTPSGSLKNRQAVAEFQQQFMNASDLALFFKKYVPNAQPGDEKVYKYVGPATQGEGIEALLDIEYIMGVAPHLKTEFWEYPAYQFCMDLVKWTQDIFNSNDAPNVHSVSYGWQGNLSQVGCADPDVDTVDTEFQKLAAKGITILFASGDSGSGESSSTCSDLHYSTKYNGAVLKTTKGGALSDCCSNCSADAACVGWGYDYQTRECELKKELGSQVRQSYYYSGLRPDIKLYPSWPASSPWVTSVGSTRFINQKPSDGEMATDQFGSGGGFSTMFPQPAWQKEAVAQFFVNEPADKLPPSGSYPKGGRATPDLAALGEGYQVVTAGGVESVGGTSASTPAFGGFVSLINEKRIAAGKKPLGFLNPWIYKNADAFFDVTVGDNRWGRGPFRLKDGFDCVKGWDPVTGWGTPNFPKLLASALALP